MLEILDHIGLLAFAISGVLTAANRNLDILGGYIIAFITALGGGTIRDLLLNVDVAWMTSFSQVAIVIVGGTIGIIFRKKLKTWRRTLSIFDTVGISVFTIVGVQKGLAHDQLPLTAVFLGMITATFGGLLRDVLSNEIPMIFRKEIYAIPCLVGGAFYLMGDYFGHGDTTWLLWSSIVFIIAFRTLAVLFSWKLPLIREFK
ncbi:MAG TPA: trimeric intracellular cation channel family protein [Brumimicrobium sp.]|nr:trimeric intracellular cation channel family protein [Brumimicrobium sp.]